MDLREIKFYKGRTILDITEKDALYCIKSPTETAFKLYVTDIDGNIVSLASVNSTISLTSSDNSISITGTAVKDLKINSSLKTLILNSIQPGSNISELNNDSGYITIADLPIFNPSDYDLEDFNNNGLDPFVRQSELTGGNTNLGYTPASNQGTVTSDTGSDAILPLATNTDAGLLSPTEKSKLAGIEDGAEVNNISDANANDLTDGNETTLHHHDSRYYTETESDNKFVPYLGATQDVDLGEYQLKAGQLELDQTPSGLFGVGKIRWNDSAGTAEIRLKGNNVTLQIGQELVKRVVNKTATNVNLLEANYQVVKIVGATGQRLSVDLAQANNAINSGTTIGVVTETINNNQEGFITYSGEVNLINTTGSIQGETWNDGDILYLSPTTPGAITKVKPTAPNHSVIIGYVEYAHTINGRIFVKIDNGYELGDLHNVNTTISKTTPLDTDSILLQDSADNNVWKKLTWSNVKATLKTYFDTLYTTVSYVTSALASFKTDNFLDATSSIQGQIDNRVITLLNDNINSSPVTGTVANSTLKSYLIPANTFSVGDTIDFKAVCSKTNGGAPANCNFRLYTNTTNNLGTALPLALVAPASGNSYFSLDRTYTVKSGNTLESYPVGATSVTDETPSNSAISNVAFNPTVDNYLIIAVQPNNAGDSFRQTLCYITQMKAKTTL